MRFCIECLGMQPTWQQKNILDGLHPGCRIARASGHGTGKSVLYAAISLYQLLVYPYSNTILTATNLTQVREAVKKNISLLYPGALSRFPWLNGHLVVEAMRVYINHYKESWYVLPRTASKHKPEGLAGFHAKHLTFLCDEASGIEAVLFDVIMGALTEKTNSVLLMSQGTRNAGFFYDCFHTNRDLWDVGHLNSEESPLVSREFLLEKLKEYGGFRNPLYQVRVLGVFPDNLSGMLISRSYCDEACGIAIEHEEPWGWVLSADVAEGVGRDSSAWTIARVSGWGENRKVDPVETKEFGDIDPKQFGREIYRRCQDFVNITACIDSDGPGLATALEAEELGVNVQRIRWGHPAHSKKDQRDYVNQRAYASVMARKAIMTRRMGLVNNKKLVEQASKIPWGLDERGRYFIMPKEQMRTKGIKSPDLFDTYCFLFLADYIPASEGQSEGYDDEIMQFAEEMLAGV